MAWGLQQQASHYAVLDVSHDATISDIRAAYRAAVLRLHPDKAGAAGADSDLLANAKFVNIQQAWEVRLLPAFNAHRACICSG